MAISGTALATSFGINSGVCIACLIIFSILRIKPVTRKFYAPKRHDHEVKLKPRALPGSLFGWLMPTLFYPEDELLTVAGMDVVVMARLLSYGWVLFAFCTFWCCALLMPINATGGYLASNPDQNGSDLDLISASNVYPGTARFWAHLISCYVVSLVALALLLAFSKDISRLRARYISTQPRGGVSHSVLVTDIPCVDGVGSALPGAGVGAAAGKALGAVTKIGAPGQAAPGAKDVALSPSDGYAPLDDEELDPWAGARKGIASGSVDDMVRREMEATYGAGSIASVNVVSDTRKLDPLLRKYDATKTQLTDLNEDYIGKIKRGVEVKKRKQVSLLPALAPKWAKEKYSVSTKTVKVDALEFLPQQLDHLYSEMRTERDAIKGERLPAAFVTFKDRFTANAAATGLHSYDETAWRVQPAPSSDEIVWGNLPMRHKQKVARTAGMWAVFVVLLIFYLPVTAAIQAVVNLDNVKKVPGLGLVTRLPFVTQVLQGILPSLVLKIFLIILPPILGLMARFEGKVSASQIDFSIVNRFFIFQIFATFIYQFVVGSALGQIQAIIADPTGSIVKLMGVSAAQTSTFFMTFIMIAAAGNGMGLLRVVPLVLFFIFSKLAGTERAKYRLWAKQPFKFGTAVANHTMILLLGLAFTCLAPLIAPFAWLYFTLSLMAQKYQLTYVVTLEYNAAGRMWINCFHQIMIGIYFLQLMTACVLGVKQFAYAALVVPLIVLSIAFHVVNISLFKRPWTLMSLREAAALDGRDHGAVPAEESEAVRLKYLSPVFKVDEAEHARLIREAGQVDAALKGDASALKLEDDVEGGSDLAEAA